MEKEGENKFLENVIEASKELGNFITLTPYLKIFMRITLLLLLLSRTLKKATFFQEINVTQNQPSRN